MTSPCKRCEKSGLSILLVRPTAVANDPAIAPPGARALETHAGTVSALNRPRLEKSRHALRLLRRDGYVYLYYPGARPDGQVSPWSVYKVYDKAALMPQGEFVFETSQFACDKKTTHPHDVRTITIADPDRIGKVWIGFSMNWWTDEIKAQVLKDKKAAGMVEVDLKAGPPAHGFKADAALIKKHVADYALLDMKHAGVDEATPFYSPAQQGAWPAAQALAQVMQRQSERSPQTEGKQMVVAIPDPVGLAADLNGIRLAQDKALKEALANSEDARALATDATLRGLEQAMRAGAALRAYDDAYGTMPLSKWNELKDTPYYREGGYVWTPLPGDGTLGQVTQPGNLRRTRTVERRGQKLGDSDWAKMTAQLDTSRRTQRVKQAQARVEQDAKKLAPYEADWLAAMKTKATLGYFGCHFDENDPGKRTAPVKAGEIYSAESEKVHCPQPQSEQRHYEDYLAHLLDKSVTDPQAVGLRAIFGNQKSVIEKATHLLSGSPDRSNADNMRDKTYDMLKGLLTLEQSARFSWLTPAFAAFAGGHHAALSAAAFLLLRGNPEKAGTYLKRLPQLSLANQTVLHAIEGAQVRGELNMPVLVRRSLSAEEAVKRMRGSPSGTYSDGDIRAASKNAKSASPKRIEVLELSDVNTETGAVTPRAGEGPRMPGHAPGARSTKAFEALQERAKSLGAPEMDQRSLSRVTNYRGAEAANLLSEGKIDRWLGIGGMVVQGIGLWQSVPTLFKQLTQETTDPAGLRDAALGVGDGVAGFTAAAADTLAGAHKLALMRQATGKHLVEVSTRLATLKTVAALAGVAGGVLNAVMSAYKAEGAKDKGDELSMWGYYAAMAAFGTSVLPSGYVAIDAASKQAVSRFIARRVLLRAAGVVTAEALTASAGAVAAFVSGVGLVLLIVGIGATVIAIAGTRDSLERWAARSYFGKGNTGNERPFENQKEEDEGLDQALNPSAAPAAPPAPIYRPGGNFGIYG